MVEAAGIEPASGNLWLEASTYLAYFALSPSSPLTGNGRKRLTYIKIRLTVIGELLN